MYWTYLKAVFSRALQPTVRVTDGLQILAASASPAVGKLLGIKMPETTGNDLLAYIGAAALAFIVIRLFWAPYALWKDGLEVAANLRLELSKPEQMVMRSLSKRQAKARSKLMENISAVVHHSIFFDDGRFEPVDIAELYREGMALCGMTGVGDVAMGAYTVLMDYSCGVMVDKEKHLETLKKFGSSFIDYLHGTLTVADLSRRLPPRLVLETRP